MLKILETFLKSFFETIYPCITGIILSYNMYIWRSVFQIVLSDYSLIFQFDSLEGIEWLKLGTQLQQDLRFLLEQVS